jgi:hypothetical protein
LLELRGTGVTAWKDFERRVCRKLGGRRHGNYGQAVSDCVGIPWSTEIKRSKQGCVLTSWLTQAKRQSRNEGKPWLLVVGGHFDRHPTVTLELDEFVRIGRLAGVIPNTDLEEEAV